MVKPCPQRLIASLVMALLGVAIYFIPSEIPLTDPPLIGPNAFLWLARLAAFGGLALAGAGIGNLFRRPSLGGLCAILLYVVYALVRNKICHGV